MTTNQTTVYSIPTTEGSVKIITSNTAHADKVVGASGIAKDYPNLASYFTECGITEDEAFVFNSQELKNNLCNNMLYDAYVKSLAMTARMPHDGNRHLIMDDPDWIFYTPSNKRRGMAFSIAAYHGKEKLIAVISITTRMLMKKVLAGHSEEVVEEATLLTIDKLSEEINAFV